jgi:hypothetical protein
MARGIFVGFTLAEVTAIRTAALAQLTAGKVRMNWSGDGISAGFQFAMNPADVLEECRFAIDRLNGTQGPRRVLSSFRC